MRILVIHHVRNHQNSDIYLSDNFDHVSNVVYGAQEMDTWAGIRLLSRNNEVWRLEISVNHRTFECVNPDGTVVESGDFELVTPHLSTKFFFDFLKYFDPSITQFSSSRLKNQVKEIISKFDVELVWSETQFYSPLLDNSIPQVIRSVNFEPSHVLAEDPGIFRFLKFFLKIMGERRAVNRSSLVSISPRDAFRYKLINLKSIAILPLRQLSYLVSSQKSRVPDSNYFVVMGSSFEVRHNRRNLDYCLKKLAPDLLKLDPSIRILIFGTRLPADLEIPNNVEIIGFSEKYQNFLLNSLGVVVPYHGGAGMQSKVFEPLTLGVPLIANSKSLAGYPFVKDLHYLHASSTPEYISQMVKLKKDSDLRKYLSDNSSHLSASLFCRDDYEQITNQILKVSAASL